MTGGHMTTERMCDQLLVGVCGSIHALHIHAYLIRFRESLTSSIAIILTGSAQRIVQPDTIRLYVDGGVFTDLWEHGPAVDGAAHIQLTRRADLFVIVPATANILAKAAHGIADDLLSTAIVSSPRPLIFAPAMNPLMWESAAVRRNVAALRADGHTVVPPEPAVSVTSGEFDLGLAPSPEQLLRELQHQRLATLRAEYLPEATREKPLSPAQRKLRTLAREAAARSSTDDPPG
jgi:phosphopantothenoylcysteine decarboxylase/phosphopantothenate--cysteine ligase